MNDKKTVRPIREGFTSITPYLFAENAARLIEFVTKAFGGEEIYRKERSDGAITHAEMRVGNGMIMLGEATDQLGPMPTSIYLYVNDSDLVYERALATGGISVFPIMTLPNGERYGGIKDICGNIWWIATHVEDVPPEEEERRWKEFCSASVGNAGFRLSLTH
jgi:PhnB protein